LARFLALALKSPLPRRRLLAVQSLGLLGPAASAAVPLLQRLAEQGDPHLRQEAAAALERIRTVPNPPRDSPVLDPPRS
jgi:hypothetical protein